MIFIQDMTTAQLQPYKYSFMFLNQILIFSILQELEEDPEFHRIVRTGYAQRPPIPVKSRFRVTMWFLSGLAQHTRVTIEHCACTGLQFSDAIWKWKSAIRDSWGKNQYIIKSKQ